MRQTCFVSLSTQERAIGIPHKVFTMKPQQIVDVVMVSKAQIAVRWTMHWRVHVIRGLLPARNIFADLVHQALNVQIGIGHKVAEILPYRGRELK